MRNTLNPLILGTIATTLVACAATPTADVATATSDPSAEERYGVVFLVRHAEKQDGSDPDLTDEGLARAERLATELSDVGLDMVWSTDTKRTMQTAGKVAAMTGTTVTKYDARTLETLAATISETGGMHLVVGHSNTVPPLVRILADDPTPYKIKEDDEYDRLYTIQLYRSGMTETDLERY